MTVLRLMKKLKFYITTNTFRQPFPRHSKFAVTGVPRRFQTTNAGPQHYAISVDGRKAAVMLLLIS
jgi:hypothetical protein